MNKCSILGETDVCYPKKSLEEFVNKNIRHKKGDDYKKLVEKYMKKRYNCQDVTCWAKHSSIFKRYEGRVLLPKHGWSKNRWLSNHDIYNVLIQFEKYYEPDFKYLLDWDIDFMAHKKDMKRLTDLINESNDVKYRSLILALWGTSKKYQYFKHWTCIFLNKDTKSILFFDSTGDIKTTWYVADVIEYISALTGYKTYIYNTALIQYDYEHCGIFCVHFINYMLASKEKNMKTFVESLLTKLTDVGTDEYYKYIKSLRWMYYI